MKIRDPEADIDGFPEAYESADDVPISFSLKETGTEKMERLTGKPVDLPENAPQTEEDDGQKKEFFQEKEKGLPQRAILDDPEIDEDLAESERRREAEKWDPHQTTDFGFGSEVSDLGYEDEETARRIRDEVDAVIFDREDSVRYRKMSEEFQAARTIFLGRRDSTENWQRVLQNLLTADEGTSIRYLKGIYNY